MSNRVGIVCGCVALAVSVGCLRASVAQSRSTGCAASHFVSVGPVSAGGCWRRTGSRWRAPTPVSLNGVNLTGHAMVTLDPNAREITSSRPVRWLVGDVQVRQAPFAWQAGKPLLFRPSGRFHGLAFAGTASLSFSRANGGTAELAAKVAIPGAGDDTTADTVLKVSRKHRLNVRSVDLRVGQLQVGRLFLNNLDFTYSHDSWTAEAAVRLPAFTASGATLRGHLAIKRGTLREISVAGKSLRIPLGAGFLLTKASLGLGLGPLVAKGSASATYGPPIGGRAALEIDGSLKYVSRPEHWGATGKVSLPWGLPGLKPKAQVGLDIYPGRSMSFTSALDLTVHGIGLTGKLAGFASAKAFNAEGDGALKLALVKLSGDAVVSSKGMSACGTIKLLFLGKKVGFGYTWHGPLDIMGSSCDIGRYEVVPGSRLAFTAAPTAFSLASPAGFTVFAAQGGAFQLSGGPWPGGLVTSTPDRDDSSAFAFHDTTDNTSYLVVPTYVTAHTYTITPLGGATLGAITYANGLIQHAPPPGAPSSDVSGTVSGSGDTRTFSYTIQTARFQQGETVSFYEGQSPTLAGAAPIEEDIDAHTTPAGTALFTPEPLGSTTRYVFAVVSIDGRPREQFPVATFEATLAAPPFASPFLTARPSGGWTVQLASAVNVAKWELLTTTGDRTRSWQETPGTAKTQPVPASLATPVTIGVTPVDQFGRIGLTYVCDTSRFPNRPSCLAS